MLAMLCPSAVCVCAISCCTFCQWRQLGRSFTARRQLCACAGELQRIRHMRARQPSLVLPCSPPRLRSCWRRTALLHAGVILPIPDIPPERYLWEHAPWTSRDQARALPHISAGISVRQSCARDSPAVCPVSHLCNHVRRPRASSRTCSRQADKLGGTIRHSLRIHRKQLGCPLD